MFAEMGINSIGVDRQSLKVELVSGWDMADGYLVTSKVSITWMVDTGRPKGGKGSGKSERGCREAHGRFCETMWEEVC